MSKFDCKDDSKLDKKNILEKNLIVELLHKVIYDEQYSSVIFESLEGRKDINTSQKSYISGICLGVIENYLILEHYMQELAKKRVKKNIKLLIIAALYEIEFMKSNANHITVNSYVNYAKSIAPHAKGFVNWILREHIRRGISRFKADSFEDFCMLYSHPKDIGRLFQRAYGTEEAIEIMKSNQDKPLISLRANLTKCCRNELLKILESEGLSVETSEKSNKAVIIKSLNGMNIGNLKSYKDGLFYIQDIASIILLDMIETELSGSSNNENGVNSLEYDDSNEWGEILDLCAAPGGKATGIAEIIKYYGAKGSILACDIYSQKIKKTKDNARRLGLDLEFKINDASVFNKNFSEKFNLVMADVPCSALGKIRKKPEIKYRKTLKNIKSVLKLQCEILQNASKYVKLGGKLVYSTCTMNPSENTEQVNRFLKENKNFILEREIQLLSSNGYSDGFFIAVMTKESKEQLNN